MYLCSVAHEKEPTRVYMKAVLLVWSTGLELLPSLWHRMGHCVLGTFTDHWLLLLSLSDRLSHYERKVRRQDTKWQHIRNNGFCCSLSCVSDGVQWERTEWNTRCQVSITRSDTFRSEACIHADNSRVFTLVSLVEKWGADLLLIVPC